MDILLIRHGQAVDDAPGLGDTGRWLTAKGRKVTRRVARWLAKSNKRRPAVIWTSPLVRAVQTAEIVAAAAEIDGEVRAISELSPGRDPGDLVKLLAEAPAGPLALVGHEPSLSLIANALLGDIGFTGLKKSGVMGVSYDEGRGKLRFLLDPAEKKAKKRLDTPPPTGAPSPPTGSMT
jgi:phosphohistidine phosphatase